MPLLCATSESSVSLWSVNSRSKSNHRGTKDSEVAQRNQEALFVQSSGGLQSVIEKTSVVTIAPGGGGCERDRNSDLLFAGLETLVPLHATIRRPRRADRA